LLEAAAQRRGQLEELDQAIETHLPTGQLLFQVLGAIAEFETNG